MSAVFFELTQQDRANCSNKVVYNFTNITLSYIEMSPSIGFKYARSLIGSRQGP